MRITALVGNPNPNSRTLQIAQAIADRVKRQDDERLSIDLADHVGSLFQWPSEEMRQLTGQVANSDILVVASPTYKASYTGLLKSFLDRYGKDGLAGVVAVPVMTGADATHTLAPDTTLRPLLVELGAFVPTRSVYFVMPEMNRMDEIIDAWFTENKGILEHARSWREELGK